MRGQLVLDVACLATREHPVPNSALGEVFTRRWIVELILDLAGFRADRDLADLLTVEPACGEGAFLGPIIERLLESATRHGRPLSDLAGCLQAFDLSSTNVERARKLATYSLTAAGLDPDEAEKLSRGWIRCEDFLLLEAGSRQADLVVGNPPYVRLENVPAELNAEYRRACPTMRGRSDVYVGFIEKGLRMLQRQGVLAFIVADRWMHNQYGSAVRKLISEQFSVDTVLEMHDVDAFEDDVSAYPAIVVIRRQAQGPSVLAQAKQSFGPRDATMLKAWVQGRGQVLRRRTVTAARLSSWFPDGELWPSGDPAALKLVADLERRFPTLEDSSTGTRVGIGVATGADSVYITRNPNLVEPDRLLPLVMSADTMTGHVAWQGSYLVNPWEDGHLVELSRYPLLAAYLGRNEPTLRRRHVARRRPASWYRTIDRIDPGLLRKPKLLLPDLKASIHPVLEEGGLYPHHNLYSIVSEIWPLDVLGGLLLSRVANLFVGTYCVKMRGGCYRFQAQYLRRIRIPPLDRISSREQGQLARAFHDRDVDRATEISVRLYGIEGSALAVIA